MRTIKKDYRETSEFLAEKETWSKKTLDFYNSWDEEFQMEYARRVCMRNFWQDFSEFFYELVSAFLIILAIFGLLIAIF